MVDRAEGGQLHTTRTLKMMDTIIHMTGAKRVLEIGFNTGHSAKAFLDCGAYVHSVDIGIHPYVEDCGRKIKLMYGDQFDLTIKNSRDLTIDEAKGYDLVFVDGDHTAPDYDIDLANNAKVKWILFDDCHQGAGWHPDLWHWINKEVDTNPTFQYDRYAMFYYDSVTDENDVIENAMMLLKRRT